LEDILGKVRETLSQKQNKARYQWLIPVILTTQVAAQEDLGSKPAPANILHDPISKKTHHKTKRGLVEWP
jgi:hypothetical protein